MPFNAAMKTQRITTDYTVSPLDDLIEADSASAVVAVSLPSFGSSTSLNYVKHWFVVVKSSVDANAVNVSVADGSLINGAATFALAAQFDAGLFCADDRGGYQGFGFRASASFTSATVTTLTTGAIVGNDSSLGITGQVAAVGGDVAITGGAASTSSGGSTILAGGALAGSGIAGGVFERSSTGMFFRQQTAPTAKPDGAAVMTAAQMINGIIVHTVTTGATLTTPTGAAISAGCPASLAVGDSFFLRVITIGTGADDISTLTAGDGAVTFVGPVTVGPDTATINAYGTWLFRLASAGTWIGYRVG